MAVRINCGVKPCKAVFDDCESYAQHIIDKHSADKERAEWAKHTLEDIKKEETSCI